MNGNGKPKYSEKTCPDTTLSTTNPTWPDLGLNLGCCGGKPATNRFSCGAAKKRQSKGVCRNSREVKYDRFFRSSMCRNVQEFPFLYQPPTLNSILSAINKE
jgi:hypothetical protein